MRRGKTRLAILVVLSSVCSASETSAGLTSRPIYQDPSLTYTLSENAVNALCEDKLHDRYNLFDSPRALCAIPAGQSSNVAYYFILDSSQGILRSIETLEDVNGLMEATWLGAYGVGTDGWGKYKGAASVTISPTGPGCLRDVYLLNNKDRRIERIRFDDCNRTFTAINYLASGILQDPEDIDCIALGNDTDLSNDMVVVADTKNHCVRAFKPDGTTIWTYGTGVAGSGPGQLSWPWAVTGIRTGTSNAAFVYIVDRGNNRILRLSQNEGFGITMDRVIDFATNVPRRTSNVGGYSLAGLEDVETDAEQLHSGVFVLDSRTNEILQLDYDLDEIIDREPTSFDARRGDLELARGTLGVLFPYTPTTGMRLFEVHASITNLQASPQKFVPPMEWAHVSMDLTATGQLDAWVETTSGSFVDNLTQDWPVYPGTEYVVWDGQNANHQQMGVGTYRIKVRISDSYWDYTETKQVDVTIATAQGTRVVTSKPSIQDPSWAPDGKKIAFSGTVGGQSNIWVYNLETGVSSNLTASEDGEQYQPCWSPDGTKILWAKEIERYARQLLYVMNADGSAKTLVSQTQGVPYLLWEEQPRWLPSGTGAFGYIHHTNSGGGEILFKQTAAPVNPTTVFNGTWYSDISWSPSKNEIAALWDGGTQGGPEADEIEVYKMSTGILKPATEPTEDPYTPRVFDGVAWSPDGSKLAVSEQFQWFPDGQSAAQWSVMTMSPNGGVEKAISGLTSTDVYGMRGIAWSADGTKIAIPIGSVSSASLVIADLQRDQQGAFPSAQVAVPAGGAVVNGDVLITGSIGPNTGVNGNPLSTATDYFVEWGVGENPESWSADGVVRLVPPGQNITVANASLATWNTGTVPSGEYTYRVRVTDGTDENIIERTVGIAHQHHEVAAQGGRQFTTIQAALNASVEGDTVIVYAGTYNERLTLKPYVAVVGKSGAVVAPTSQGYALDATNLNSNTLLDGLEVHAASGYGGLWVSNSGLTVSNCTFVGMTQAVHIDYGHVKFKKCTFTNNTHPTTGGAVWINPQSWPEPTTFDDCTFSGNSTGNLGGAVYLTSTTSYSESAPQVGFARCRFEDDSAPYGAAVRAGNYRRPWFDHCVFVGNHSTVSSGGSVIVSSGGSRVDNCTFSSNTGTGAFDVIRVDPLAGVPPVTINSTIFCNNTNGNALGSYGSTYIVAMSDFYGNASGDAAWAAGGTQNFSANPAFCPSAQTLEAFSPCAEQVSGIGLVGALGVACVPNADVTLLPGGTNAPSNLIFGCPGGDGDSLAIQVDFDDNVMTRTIQPDELSIEPPYSTMNIYSNKKIVGDVPTDASFKMILGHKYISGYGTDHITLFLDGYPLAQQAIVQRRGPDLKSATNPCSNGVCPDGMVTLADFGYFTEYYPNGPYAVDRDFDGSGTINLTDFGMFCTHYHTPAHQQPFSEPLLTVGDVQTTPAHVEMSFTDEYVTALTRRLSVDLSLADFAGIPICLFAVRTNRDDLTLSTWVPTEWGENHVLFTTVDRVDVHEYYVGVVMRDDYTASTRQLGRLVFDVRGASPLEITDDQFVLVAGEVQIGADGEPALYAQLSGVGGPMGRTLDHDVRRVFHNRLEQNFPNPFNPQTTLAYSINGASNVSLTIYDVAGRRVRELVHEHRQPGAYKVTWDGTDARGSKVASGVYFYKLVAGSFIETKKMIMLK